MIAKDTISEVIANQLKIFKNEYFEQGSFPVFLKTKPTTLME